MIPPRVETLDGVPRPLTGVAGLCVTLLIAVAGGAAVPPTVAHGAAGPGVERPPTRDEHARACPTSRRDGDRPKAKYAAPASSSGG